MILFTIFLKFYRKLLEIFQKTPQNLDFYDFHNNSPLILKIQKTLSNKKTYEGFHFDNFLVFFTKFVLRTLGNAL